MEFNELIRKARKTESVSTPALKLAVMGQYASQYFCKALLANAKIDKINLDLYEADFDQIELETLDPNSKYYQHDAAFTVILYDSKVLYKSYLQKSEAEKENFAQQFISNFSNAVNNICGRSRSKVITFNLAPWKDDVFNLLSLKKEGAFGNQLQIINAAMSKLSQEIEALFVADTLPLFFAFGKKHVYSSKLMVTTSQPYELNFIPQLTKVVMNYIQTLSGKVQKCLILDLDNTLWGGVIGDDGINNIEIGDLGDGKIFTEIQLWAKNLKERGVILCICSKNNEEVAKEPFEKLEDMELRLDDISVFVANWNNKADNIRYIQKVLNIGFDAMVFVDDNPAERDIVKSNLPEVCVPDLPAAPEDYMTYLSELNLFSTVSYSAADKDRTKQYQDEAKRVSFSQSTNIEDYLESLEMKADVQALNEENRTRIAQLTQRSNQFNLRTQRFSEDDLINWSKSLDNQAYSFDLKDKFGAYGIICVIMLEGGYKGADTALISNWMMSCRVLKRGVEDYCMNYIVDQLKAKGIEKVYGQYLPTAKNQMVAAHYEDLGFKKSDEEGLWELELSKYKPKDNYIQ